MTVTSYIRKSPKYKSDVIGVARACIPQGEKYNFGAEFMGVSCKCTLEGESSPLGGEDSHFYWAEEGAGR